jgi:hypothetical protein
MVTTINENKVTLVSAFVSNVNEREDRDLEEYFNLGKLLLMADIPKIIFLDESMYELVSNRVTNLNPENTKICKINKTDSYLYGFQKYITNFKDTIKTDNPNKDTIEFMFTMCNKTEWIKMAIIRNDFNTENFVWVDFGIHHIFQLYQHQYVHFLSSLHSLKNKVYDKVRIAAIQLGVNMMHRSEQDLYKWVMWYFAGGVFGGDKHYLLKFAELMKEKCIEIITEKGTIMWEINIWYLIWRENPELFDYYHCGHDASILDKY